MPLIRDQNVLGNFMQEIDSEIEGHYAAIADLRFKRNSLLSINRIPPELLSNIFHFFRACTTVVARTLEARRVWVMVTRICRHWRDVALSTPRLWSYLDLD